MTIFPKRGVIYVRVSTEEQRRGGYSIPSQIRLVREKMKSDNVEEVHVPIIDADSGKDFERKGLKELWELVRAKVIDFVYIFNLDRLGRHMAETPYLMWTLKENGVIVRDLNHEYNFEDPMQYVIATMECARAHVESDRIVERTQNGKNEKFAQGKWIGQPPFGYRENEKEELEKVPELEPIIYDIFITYKALRNLKETAQAINKKYLGKIGKRSPNQIRTILRKYVYIGLSEYNKAQIDAPELRVIPTDLFADVQNLLESKSNRHKAKKSRKPESILDTIAREYGSDYVLRLLKILKPFCPKCGSLMVGNGPKLLKRLNVTVQNFLCTKASCKHQKTIPSEKELKYLQENHVSCPRCRAVEDYNKTAALDGSVRYDCRRCGTSFQFTPSKEAEQKDETQSNRKNESNGKSEQSITNVLADLFKQHQNVDVTRLQKAVQIAILAGFQLSKDAFDHLSKIAETIDPLKVIEDAIRCLQKLESKPFFIERRDLEW